MTNLEYYKDELKRYLKDESGLRHFRYWETRGHDNFIDWLLAEHKEPIRLKQWEKDLLESLYRSAEDRFVYMGVFKYHAILRNMKVLGHFKGVKDDDMTLARILDNCEVIE